VFSSVPSVCVMSPCRKAAVRPQAVRLRWPDQASLPQEGARGGWRAALFCCLLAGVPWIEAVVHRLGPFKLTERPSVVWCLQAKTTKKIVLRLACNVCKAVHMHPIKRVGTLCLSTAVLCDAIHGISGWITSGHGSLKRVIHAVQCKHFEIGGEKKHKSIVY
jgi:Ribosomal protein L44